jgi:hypothetical protein
MLFGWCTICDIGTYVVVIEGTVKCWPRVVKSMLSVPSIQVRGSSDSIVLRREHFMALILIRLYVHTDTKNVK